jgi:hypothetical protein
VADDLPAGENLPKQQGGVPRSAELPPPAVGERAIPEGEPPPEVTVTEDDDDGEELASSPTSSGGKRKRRKKR